jgi:23S rRNA maturation-related 3'-5' exoribonuclease YhaM
MIKKLATFPTRYAIVILSALTNAISYTMRTNLNLTIVAMVKKPYNHSIYETCLQYNESITSLQESDARILKQKHKNYNTLKKFVFPNIENLWSI